MQVTYRRNRCCVPVKNVVREPDEFAVTFGDQTSHWLIPIEEARPRRLRNLERERRRSDALVESVIAFPQCQPRGELVATRLAD